MLAGQVLFFGDSMRSDISPAKKYANWDTVLVLEEMEAELDDTCDISDSSNDDSNPAAKRPRLVVSIILMIIIAMTMFMVLSS